MTDNEPSREEIIERIEKAAARLRRMQLMLAVVSLAVGAAYLAVMIGWGSLRLREFVAGEGRARWAVVFWYLLFFTLIYNVVHFPVSYMRGYVVERRFRLSEGRLGRWLWAEIKKYLVSAIFIVILGECVYLFLGWFPRTWWFYAWAAYLVFGLLLNRYGSRVLLPLFYKRGDLGDEALEARLSALVRRAGYRAESIKRIAVGKDTRRANAAVAGFGRSREILVSDTLIEMLDPGEMEAVVAHELAHARLHHSEVMLVVGTIASLVAFVLAAGALSLSSKALGFSGVGDVAGFPLIVAVFAGLFLTLSPFLNYISRGMEHSADIWAGRFVGNPENLARAIEKLAANNLAERTRPRYHEILFASHPSPGRRAAYLRKLAERINAGE